MENNIMLNNSDSSWEVTVFCHAILSALDRLLQCLEGLSEEQLNWHPPVPNTNSLSALTVHTLGNVEENLLYILYDRASPRNREQEFLAQGQTTDEFIARWRDLRERLQPAILNLSSQRLEQEYAHPRRGAITGLGILVVVAMHCAEHLGQAELTRDLLFAATQDMQQ